MSKARRKVERGRRISFWLPQKDYWMIALIEARVRQAEDMGNSLSMGDVIRTLLRETLEKDLPLSPGSTPPPT